MSRTWSQLWNDFFFFLSYSAFKQTPTFSPQFQSQKWLKPKQRWRQPGGWRCFSGSTGYFQTNEGWYVGALIGCRIPWGQRHTGGVGVGSRLPGDMRKTDMEEEELLAWEGIIKLSNIKIQYHQKKKNKENKKTKQTVHHFCFYNCSLLQT